MSPSSNPPRGPGPDASATIAEPAVLTPAVLDQLRVVGQAAGLASLGAVALDDPGFEPARQALVDHIAGGRHGEMDFMARTQAVRERPEAMLEAAQSMLVAIVPYAGEAGPVARYAQSSDYHSVIHQRLQTVADALTEILPGVRTLIAVDTKPVMERAAAVLAGHGFIGKHGCVIVPGFGSYVLLGEILTTARWDPVQRPSLAKLRWGACGECTLCLDACPTNAFEGPGVLDPRRCISYLTIEHRGEIEGGLADAMGERIVGCDVCQEVCPYNASSKIEQRTPARARLPAPGDGALQASLVELANIRSGRYRAFVRGTAVRRIPRRAMRRNALLALGNRQGPLTREEDAAATASEADADPQIVAAARRLRERRAPKKSSQ